MEKKAADEMEMAAQANEERKKAQKTAQGQVKIVVYPHLKIPKTI